VQRFPILPLAKPEEDNGYDMRIVCDQIIKGFTVAIFLRIECVLLPATGAYDLFD
jgi:hypothetical protein